MEATAVSLFWIVLCAVAAPLLAGLVPRRLVPEVVLLLVFGMIIGTVGCYLGFTTTQGTEGVGRTATRSVVLSSIMIIVTNVVLVRLIFFMFPANG